MKCVIPCAGKGTRMGTSTPKALLEVNGQPVLNYIVKQWEPTAGGFVVVVHPMFYRSTFSNKDVTYAIQEKPRGLADAVLQAEPYVNGKFIVNLGDCLFRGRFDETDYELGVGVWQTGDLVEVNKSYLVIEDEGLVQRVVEKPGLHPADVSEPQNCGMGVYFLDERIFRYIRDNLEKNFTDVLQVMIDAGEKITPIWFKGEYINVTHPEDIKRAERILR